MIQVLSSRNFRRFGHIIENPKKHLHEKTKNLFRIVCREREPVGWRIAYLIVRDTEIIRLEQHPMTFESFEPVKGKTLLYLSREKDPQGISCFFLDKPVILHKGVWHGVVTLGKESEIKITENAFVRSVYWNLGFSLNSNHKKKTRRPAKK